MTVSYHVLEVAPWRDPCGETTLVRIVDRNQVLITTNLGAVFISRSDAARCLREVRRRMYHPFVSSQGNAVVVTYEKVVTP